LGPIPNPQSPIEILFKVFPYFMKTILKNSF
jgi:hypothetical protein